MANLGVQVEKVIFIFLKPNNRWEKRSRRDMWAPEIHFVSGEYHVYFSGRKEDNSDQLAVGVAISTEG